MIDGIYALAWDSSFFTQKVGQCKLADPQLLSGLMQEAGRQGYSLLYIESQHNLTGQSTGCFSLLDVGGRIKYVKKLLPSSGFTSANTQIFSCSLQDINSDILDLAYLSGSLSRFRVDPALPSGSFEKLYQAWLLQTLECMPMGAVYAYLVEGRPVGLITSEWDQTTCTIGLLAVHPSWQGMGIATKLIHQVESLCFRNNLQCLEVKTQLVNISARALYVKNSFSELERAYLYHAHVLAR